MNLLCEVSQLAERKLVIKPLQYGTESTVISVRIPKDMLSVVERVAEETGRSRNEIILMSLEFALDNLSIDKKQR